MAARRWSPSTPVVTYPTTLARRSSIDASTGVPARYTGWTTKTAGSPFGRDGTVLLMTAVPVSRASSIAERRTASVVRSNPMRGRVSGRAGSTHWTGRYEGFGGAGAPPGSSVIGTPASASNVARPSALTWGAYASVSNGEASTARRA